MSNNAERGTKRRCQNSECGSRFYDLNRNPITCPVCSSVYQIAVSPSAMAAAASAGTEVKAQRKPVKKPVYAVDGAKPEDAPEAEAEDALVPVEGEEEPAAADEDETFLEEEEEDGPDVSGIIGTPVAEPEEPL